MPGLRQPLLQFVRGETRTLTVELFFDGTETQTSVVDAVGVVTDPGTPAVPPPTGDQSKLYVGSLSALRAYTEIQPDLHAPPVCKVSWGDFDFTGVVTQIQERFQIFDENGFVLRARANVTIKSFVPASTQAQTSSTQSPDRFKTRVVKAGDRLDEIAAEEYGDPKQWAVIARFNNLARPRVLKVGTVLQIPPL